MMSTSEVWTLGDKCGTVMEIYIVTMTTIQHLGRIKRINSNATIAIGARVTN